MPFLFRDRVPYGTVAPVSNAVGFDEVEFEAVIGCDCSAVAITGRSASGAAWLVFTSTSTAVETLDVALLKIVSANSGAGGSMPFSRGEGICDDPATLERREGSFVMLREDGICGGRDSGSCMYIRVEALPAR